MAAKIVSKIGRGIYRLSGGAFRVKVTIGDRTRGGRTREKQFSHDTGLREMKGWQTQQRAALLREGLVPVRGTLEADIPTYLAKKKPQLQHPDSRQYEINAWLSVFGPRKRHTITRDEINNQVRSWQRAGVSASTIRHRLSALSTLFKELDGDDACNPVARVPRPKEPAPKPGGPSFAVIGEVLDALIGRVVANNRGWETLARVRLIALTGMRHSQVMRLSREDFVLDAEIPYIVVADPGKDGEPHIKPLTQEGVNAARLFVRVGCFGRFSQSSVYKSWKRACEDAHVAFFNPYKMRHAYATALRAEGMDLADVQTLLGHKSARTTQRYAAISPSKFANAAKLIDRAWNRARGQSAWASAQVAEKTAASDK